MQRLAERQQRLNAELQQLLSDISTLTLEIGSGHGHFFTAYAQEHRESFCLGLDLLGRRVRLANQKAHKRGLDHLHFVRADAEELLRLMPEHVRVDRCFILFPDPWPKKKHHKNRLIQPGFLNLLASRMAADSYVYFRTDHEDYFAWTVQHFAAHPAWLIDDLAPWPFEAPSFFQDLAPSYASLAARVLTPGKPT